MKLQTVRTAALALPETTEEPHHNLGSLRVRGKIFVTVPPGGTYIHVFVNEQDREMALAAADAAVVKRLLRQAYRYQAAKSPARLRDRTA